jgi:hypothetical protein
MGLRTYDEFIDRVSDGYYIHEMFWDENQVASVNLASNLMACQRLGKCKQMPDPLPTGVTNYIVTRISCACSTSAQAMLFARLVNLGSIDIGTNTFTDGVAMPTRSELGSSIPSASPIIIEVTTALNATPGSITTTYIDQDGNAAQATSAIALSASMPAGSSGYLTLGSNDWGVQDITNVVQSGGTTPSGVVKLWGVIPIAFMPASAAVSTSHQDNLLTSGFNPQRFGAGIEIGSFVFGASVVAKAMYGDIFIVGDS